MISPLASDAFQFRRQLDQVELYLMIAKIVMMVTFLIIKHKKYILQPMNSFVIDVKVIVMVHFCLQSRYYLLTD